MEKHLYFVPIKKNLEVGDICKSKLTDTIIILDENIIKMMESCNDIHWTPYQMILISKDIIKTDDYYLYDLSDVTDKGNDFEIMKCQDDDEADRCNTHFMIKHNCFKIIAAYPKIENLPTINKNILSSIIENKIKDVDIQYDDKNELMINSDNEIILKLIDRFSKSTNTSLF
jgi:hypothetical protein